MTTPLVPTAAPAPGNRARRSHRRRTPPISATGLGLALASLPLLVPGLSAQATATIVGEVVDAETAAPVADVEVTLAGTALEALTDDEGRFEIEGVRAGSQTLVFRHLAYGEHTQPVEVGEAPIAELLVRISAEAIELSPVVVEALGDVENRRRTMGSAVGEIRFDEIQEAARTGARLPDLLRQMPGVRLRPAGAGECLEYRLLGAGVTCRNMAILMDGQLIGEPGALLASIDLDEIQRLEILSPSQAGSRYGGYAAHGLLVIETRAGPIPGGALLDEPVTFYEWSGVETEPYPWPKVAGAALLAYGAAAALTYLPVAFCTHAWEGSLQRRSRSGLADGRGSSRCSEPVSFGSALLAMGLPGPVTGWVARRVGDTAHSRGTIASATVGTLTHLTGHVLFFHGRASGSGGLEATGLAMLAVGTPLLVTLADRLFRSPR